MSDSSPPGRRPKAKPFLGARRSQPQSQTPVPSQPAISAEPTRGDPAGGAPTLGGRQDSAADGSAIVEPREASRSESQASPPSTLGDVPEQWWAGAPAAEPAPPSDPALEELKEVEPWAMPGTSAAATPSDSLAGALERVARQVRDGSLVLQVDAAPDSDEEALALALAAVLRSRRRG